MDEFYSVTFVADHFTLTTNQYGATQQDAIDGAIKFMETQYGLKLESIINDIDIEQVEL